MSATFWNLIAKHYAKSPVADEATYQKKLQVTRGYFHPNMEVLEFGCGTGSTAITHAPHVKHIRAIDISSKMLDIARGKAHEKQVENVTFEQATIEQLSVPDQSLDAVLGLSILHLLANKEETIAKVHRMLKPGRVFVTSTACIADTLKFWSLAAFFFKVIAPIGRFFRLLPLIRIFTSQQLQQSLTDAGFVIEHKWHPGDPAEGKGVFIVARRAES